jgi:hypothetical protein
VPEQSVSGIGEGDRPRRPVEQACTDTVLELAELLAECLLGDVQPAGSAGEVQLVGEDLEGLELAQLDIHNSSL